MDDSTSEELKTLIQLMGANDWQKRQEGIEQFHDLTMRNPDACVAQLVKVILEYKKILAVHQNIDVITMSHVTSMSY